MGIFKHAGGEICRGITRSVGSSIPLHWEPMGEGVTDDVNGSEIARAQAVHHGKLAIGGKFDSVSGTPASNVAEWDGSTWSAMGLGLNGMVFSLCDNNGDLFAGGSFGGAIATWAEGAWTQVGSGFTSVNGARVFSLLSFEGNLIAAGTFDFSGAQIIKNIARWDGHTWWSLGSGLNKSVNCAALYKGDLIVGGFFTSSGNVSCNGIARWDGSSWHPLGAGITPSSSSASPVNSMAVYNDWLIVTGSFVSAGGIPAKGIAAWDGQQWFSIGEVDNSVWDMRVWNGDLVLGGQFKSLGGLPSHYFGRFGPISTSPPVINVHPSAGLRALGDNVSMRVVASGCPAPSYQWFKNGAALFEDVRIHGVFSPAIKIEQITKDDAGRYTCLIDNGVGSDISLPATLRVGSLSAVDLESP